jgi:hypothetical protein
MTGATPAPSTRPAPTHSACQEEPVNVRSRPSTRPTRTKVVLRWLPTFFAFPLGAVAAKLVVGPVDDLAAALVGGAITGIVLGAAQSWALGPNGPSARRWIAATAVGLALGLAIGSTVVDFGFTAGDLAVQGAVCGLAVGAAQATVLRPRVGGFAFAWPPVLGGLWALGWTITTVIGVDVESQYTVFGSSGALTVTVATAALPLVLARRAETSAS